MNAQLNDILNLLFRWLHVLAGIVWIGHLYFFNWVNGPFQGKIDGPTKKVVNPELMPRALYWFRWGAAYTWITGVLLLGMVYYMGEQALATGADWSAGPIIMIVVTFLAVFIYDALWKSGLAAPETPVTTVNSLRGISTSMDFRLCSRALWILIESCTRT